MKGTLLVAIVAIVVIIVGTSIFMYIGLPINTGVQTTNTTISTPQTTPFSYVITFAYTENIILAGQNQTITIQITQGSLPVASVPGVLYVNSPNQTYYQDFGFNTDANGEATFNFLIAQNAVAGTYNVFALLGSLGQIIENESSSFIVAA